MRAFSQAPRQAGRGDERRAGRRLAAYGFPLLAPPEACIVDCGRRGVGVETSAHLSVGSLTKVDVLMPSGGLTLIGRVCWARLVDNRRIEKDESRPVYRAGISFLAGQSFGGWDELLSGLIAVAPLEPRRRRHKVVKWRPPSSRGQLPAPVSTSRRS